jgi:hypothetical protein
MSDEFKLNSVNIKSSCVLPELIFTRKNCGSRVFYTHSDQYYYPMSETVEHRNIRCKNALATEEDAIIDVVTDESPLIEEIVSRLIDSLHLINAFLLSEVGRRSGRIQRHSSHKKM